MLKNIIYSALGVTSLTTKKVKSTIEELIKSGEITRAEGEKIVNSVHEKLKSETQEAEEMVEKLVKKVISKLNLVTKDDFDKVKSELDELKAKNN
jgi:polyhydroxyalkanoate synthesis regulator phasin